MQNFEQAAPAWRTGMSAPSSAAGMEESLVLAACPSAARCSKWLVRVELPRWGLGHLASTIENLTCDLVEQIVQTIGPVEPPAAWQDNQDVPMIRCVLWSHNAMAGVRVWDPTPFAIPALSSARLHPSVEWGQSRTAPNGKWTWFQMSISLKESDASAPHTIPIPKIDTRELPRIESGELPRVNSGEFPRIDTGGFPRLDSGDFPRFDTHLPGSPADRFFGVELTTN